MDLGIQTTKLSPAQVSNLEKSVASAIEVNERERVVAAEIQRRGTNLPGDVGQNFGLYGPNQFHGPSVLGPYDLTYPGSRYFSGFFGGGYFNYGMNNNGLYNTYGQGSFAGFKRNTQLAHYKMGMCVQAYKGFGVARNVIDLMANFAAEGLTIKHPRKGIEKFYKRWAQHVDLQGRVKDMLRYYYKYGNVFIYTTMGIIDQKAYERMKRAKGKTTRSLKGFRPVQADGTDPNYEDRVDRVEKETEKPVSERQIPWQYTLLNPFQMEIRGSRLFGGSRWIFVMDDNTLGMLKNNAVRNLRTIDFLDESKVNLPPEFAKLVKLNKAVPGESTDARVVELDQSRLWTMHYMKDDHEDWADPLLWPVMNDIHYKNKLRQMDISVCNSVINAVTIFRLGDWKAGFVPPKQHFEKFAELLRTPTQAMNMVWNDAISVETSYPPVEKILSIAKYESVDRDILRGLGVPDTLLGGTVGQNFSTGFLGVRTLLERLEEGRNTVMRWINKQLEMIAAIMGHRDVPKIRFGRMSLRDEKAEKQLILNLLDRNIISIEAVLEAFGEDFEIELERMRDEDKIREDTGLLVKHGPFTDPYIDDAEDVDIGDGPSVDKKPTGPGGRPSRRSGDNGRPPNTKEIRHENKRETKPRGMSWLMEYEEEKTKATTHIANIEEIVTETILSAKGKKYKKALSKHDREGIEQITYAVASHLDFDLVSLDNIQNILRARSSMHSGVYRKYSELLSNDMSLDQRKLAIATAIAMRNMEVKDAGR